MGEWRCKACGDCCTHMYLPVDPDLYGYHKWLFLHGFTVVKSFGQDSIRLDIPCKMLDKDTGLCTIYEKGRPEMCRMARCEDKRKLPWEK